MRLTSAHPSCLPCPILSYPALSLMSSPVSPVPKHHPFPSFLPSFLFVRLSVRPFVHLSVCLRLPYMSCLACVLYSFGLYPWSVLVVSQAMYAACCMCTVQYMSLSLSLYRGSMNFIRKTLGVVGLSGCSCPLQAIQSKLCE